MKKKLLYKILKKFNGIGKIEAYNLTHKLETFLFYTSNPVNVEDFKQIITSDLSLDHEIDPFHFTILPNGNSCEFDGFNESPHIYKENRKILSNWPILDTYYFKTKYAPIDLKKLIRKSLLINLKGKLEEEIIKDFFKESKISKKNIITNRLLILEALFFTNTKSTVHL